MELMNLATLLRRCESLPVERWVFLERPVTWDGETTCALVDLDDLEDPEGSLEIGTGSFRLALEVAAVQGVVANATEQRPDVSEGDLLRALRHYFEHDGFLEF